MLLKVVLLILAYSYYALAVNSRMLPNMKLTSTMEQFLIDLPIMRQIYQYSMKRSSAKTQHSHWMESGKYQGDIVVKSLPDSPFQLGVNGIILNAAVKPSDMKWSHGRIPYLFSPSFSKRERAIIEKAMNVYRQKTCVSFEAKRTENDYLNIVKGYGCYSQVGKTGGRQEISLGRGCLYHEIIVHELMHAVGFWHEHSRADRDQHIDVQWSNIMPGMSGQFDKVNAAYQNLVGPYDYHSVMHYDSTAFSRNGMVTIETMTDGFTDIIGTASDLSEIDLLKINTLYECNSRRSQQRQRTAASTSTSTHAPPTTTQSASPVTDSNTHIPSPNGGATLLGSSNNACRDSFMDCKFFYKFCFRSTFVPVMKRYCPSTCKYCRLEVVDTTDARLQQTGEKKKTPVKDNRNFLTAIFG